MAVETEVGDPLYIARALYVLATVNVVAGDHECARRSLAQALANFRELDHLSGVAHCLEVLTSGRATPLDDILQYPVE